MHIIGNSNSIPNNDPVEFNLEGLWEIYSPFWADLPHTDIFLAITPDVIVSFAHFTLDHVTQGLETD